jgi:two-component system OmpR family response regulator/two-component system phosphate regulon response regulator OmpR
MNKQLAIVEDDPDVRAILQRSLSADGYGITVLSSGVGLEALLAANHHDLVILDVGLPDIDGLTLTRRIRASFDGGIIIVSGRGDLLDRVVGLELGADDYVTKPFEPREILARVRSVLRRNGRAAAASSAPAESRRQRLAFDGWLLDMTARALSDAAGQPVPLTSGEYKLLEVFVTHANRVLSRDRLLDLIYESDTPAFDRSIDVRIGRVRKKLGDDPRNPRLIKTVRNDGYIFVGKVTTPQ